ncbi:MAG: YgiT-type zinc finger protein [Planctomycetota bacterium]|jgi:YgiT-type zinc finger domain-containing protein
MICDCCGKKGAVTKHVTRSFGRGKSILVIEDVPMVVCPKCGQSYFTAETLHELERLRLHKQSVGVQRVAPVIKYA